MDGLSPVPQERSPSELPVYDRMGSAELQGLQEADEGDLGHFSDSQGALDWMSTLNYPSPAMEGGTYQ
eukprot:CAMPEP_0180399940 /NCGR_PEP_ID=MMETSP0989-20121125/37442_1 /TAXON_ID=697907 /ORGANISM="non described non described, Strain CCMP2293" /LENGTH=67 /DNA_ID=CAMNT_0022402707 /DNA_START=96 /DNA_END=296 /DNA_ORIENTATION=+